MSAQLAQFTLALRRNIALDGDVDLAHMELAAFFPSRIQPLDDIAAALALIPPPVATEGSLASGAYARPHGQQGFSASGPLALLPTLIHRLSFIQCVYCIADDNPDTRAQLAALPGALGPVFDVAALGDRLFIRAIPHYALIELSDVVARHSADAAAVGRNLTALLDALLGRASDRHALHLAHLALSTHSTTSHLSHDVHYYKAKFFPRLARAMLNVCGQRLGDGLHRTLDNFAGSGTALLEAALLGIPSVGLDIDPLSAMIARAKLEAVSLSSALLADEAARATRVLFDAAMPDLAPEGITFPAWLLKNRNMTPDIAARLSAEIGIARAAIAGCDPRVENLLRVLLSDAIARKIRMRFLGTGVGRFALSFARAPLPLLFARAFDHYVRVAATCEWLRDTIHLSFAQARVLEADARRIPDTVGRFDILVTSPPYLPASSGRESYTKARAPSLIALGMRDHLTVDRLVDDTIGSMEGAGVAPDILAPAERDIVEWLSRDPLRAIKAGPTARYFADMRRAFHEMHRVLTPGALAVVVSGKTSTFYEFASRTALYVVPAAELLAAQARDAGFEIEALHDVQLVKSNRNARPRSLDDYYETLILLRRP